MKKISLFFIVAGMFIAGIKMGFAEPALTIYNRNFAVVRDQLQLDLKKGINDVRVTKITALLEPDSVILRDPKGNRAIQILEQNYRADPVSQGRLLSFYQGKTIDFLIRRGEKTKIVPGKIVRSGSVPYPVGTGQRYYQRRTGVTRQPIIEVDGKLRFGLPGIPLFPSLANDSLLKPTLHWLIETNRAGKFEAELSYLTGGMSWKANYNIVAPEQGDVLDLVGWVTMDNRSGRTFKDARIKLMAGDVNKIQSPQACYNSVGLVRERADGVRLPVSEKTFDEYHLYTLRRPTTLRDGETTQVEFLQATGVKSQRIYIYDGAKIDRNRYRGRYPGSILKDKNYGTQSSSKVWVMREFVNSKANNLDIPLPRGRVRFYRRDKEGQLEFTGENILDPTPRGGTVRLYTGNAFDLAGKRRRTDYRIDLSRKWLDESFEIKLSNQKKKEVKVRVVEHLYRWINWEITKKSEPYLKTDSRTIEFRVQLKPDQEKAITYTVHYTW